MADGRTFLTHALIATLLLLGAILLTCLWDGWEGRR